MFKNINLKSFITASVLYVFCSVASAYSVSPILLTLTPKGAESKKTVDIKNDSDEPIAIELSVAKRLISKEGVESIEVNDATDKAFGIYPAQLVIRPNSTRTVQVQYLGDKSITTEQAYRMMVEEVSIDFERPAKKQKSQGGVDFLVEYRTSLYVAPKGAKADLVVKSLKKENDQLVLEVENKGNAHTMIVQPKLQSAGTVVLDEKSLGGMIDTNVLAGNTRVYKMPWPKGKTVDQLKGLNLTY